MNKTHSLKRLLALMLCALLLTCGAATAEETADQVVATVNGVEVLQSEVEIIYNNLYSSYSTYIMYGYLTEEDVSGMALDYAVQLEVMRQKATELGYTSFTEEELAQLESDTDAYWEELVGYVEANLYGLTDESTDEEKSTARLNALAYLESLGYTRDDMLEENKDSLWFDKLYAMIVEGADVTDEEVEAYFNELVLEDEASYKDDISTYEMYTQYYGYPAYYTPEGYRGIVQILLSVDDEVMSAYTELAAQLEEQISAIEAGEEGVEQTVTQAQVDEAAAAVLASVQPTVDEIMAKYNAGTAFTDLIDEYNTDPGMQSEPYRSEGYSVHMDSVIWDPAFIKAAFSVDKVGDVSEPVLGSYGVYLVQYLRDVPAGPVALTDELRASLYEELVSSREDELFDTTMDGWMNAAEIVYPTEPAAEAE